VVRVTVGDSSEPNVKYLPIATDHSGMVKYSRTDDNYDYVKDNIKAMVAEAVKARDRPLEAIAEEDETPVPKLERAKPLRDMDPQEKGKWKGKGKGKKNEREVLRRRN
jgi:hypothetical protein